MKKKQAIKDLALRHQPRFKVKQQGISALTNSELLALIIGSGQRNCNVLELAKKVERKILVSESLQNQSELSQISGIGEVLAGRILASLELGQRLATSKEQSQISQPQQIFTLALDLRHKKQEYCLAFYLNGRQELLSKKTIAIGSLNYNFLQARDLFAPAFLLGASSIILAHNHPSGNCQPSDEDLLMTEKIAKMADLLGVKLLDHLIIGKSNYFSIKEHFSELLNV